MLCAELEQLEAELNEIITELESEDLSKEQRKRLEDAYARLSHTIQEHQMSGHKGGPCYEESYGP